MVSFTDGGATIGCPTQTVSGGVASCSVGLAAGNHPIKAVYSGDGNFNASTSGVVTQTVNKDTTATKITLSPDPAVPGQTVTYSAQVTATGSGSGIPTGAVSFTDGGNPIPSCPPVQLTGGTGNCTVAYATTGNHTIEANYAGDINFDASRASSVGETVSSCGPNLVGCNLAGANLTGANLAGANLTGINLKTASLVGANLSGSNLSRTNLAATNLTGANLTGANLTGANLKAANLNGVSLNTANLTGASLFDAHMSGVSFIGVTWSKTTCPDGTISNSDGGTCLGHL
jgi:hypothetical protein